MTESPIQPDAVIQKTINGIRYISFVKIGVPDRNGNILSKDCFKDFVDENNNNTEKLPVKSG